MSDYIRRSDAIDAVQDHFNANGFKGYDDGQKMMDRIKALPSAELPNGDLISRADAIESMANAIWHYPNELYADLNDYNMAEALAKDGLMSVTSQNLTKPNKTCEVDLINRADAIEVISKHSDLPFAWWKMICRELKDLPSADAVSREFYEDAVKANIRIVMENRELKEQIESADAVQGAWIPCSEKMPKELERLNVTWLNHNPPFYYQHIKDIPLTDTAVYYRGKWYWWDVTVIDALAEYGEDSNAEQIGKDIEVVAWMPLPKPYKGGDTE